MKKGFITPAIEQLNKGLQCMDFPPMVLLMEHQKFDGVLAMYHDQGLAPFNNKSKSGVNFTAGLPIIRTSDLNSIQYCWKWHSR